MTESPLGPGEPVVIGRTVTYYAISYLKSRTVRVNAVLILIALVPLLADPDLIATIPPAYLVLYTLAVKGINIALRFVTVRPIAVIPPGDTLPVTVPMIDAPTAATD